MAAWHDRHIGPQAVVALLIYLAAMLVLLGIVLWRLWTEVLSAWPT